MHWSRGKTGNGRKATYLRFDPLLVKEPDLIRDGAHESAVDHRDVVTSASLEFPVPVLANASSIRGYSSFAKGKLQKGVGFKEPEEFGEGVKVIGGPSEKERSWSGMAFLEAMERTVR